MSDPVITTTPVPDPQYQKARNEMQNTIEGLRMTVQGGVNYIKPFEKVSKAVQKALAEFDVVQQEITRLENQLTATLGPPTGH